MIDHFQDWLARRYSSIANLNGAWRTHHASFDQIPQPWPPRVSRRDDLPPILDWLVFCDEAALGEDRPQDDLFNQFPPRPTLHGSQRAPHPVVYEHARMLARQRLADGSKRSAQRVVDRATGDGDGDGTRGDGSEEMRGLSSFAFRAALMHGATCDINALRAGPAAVMIAPADLALAAMLAEADMRPDRKLLMLYPRLYAHLRMILAANSASGRPADDGTSADVAAMDLGFVRPPQTEGPSLFRKLLDLADRCGFPWEVADSRLPPERLLDYALVVCPTLEMLDHPTMQHLDDFVSINRGYAAIGPRVPMLNEQLRGERTLARHFEKGLSEFAQEIYRVGDGVFFTLPGFMSAATIDFLCFESGLARGLTATQPQPSTMQPDLTVVDEDLDVVVHRNGRRRMVFVANPTSLPRTADLTREPVRRLIPLEPSADGLSQAASPVGPMRLTIPPKRIMVFAAE